MKRLLIMLLVTCLSERSFDVLAVVRDIVDPVNDEKLAIFVVENHIKSHPVKVARDQEAREAGLQLPEGNAMWVGLPSGLVLPSPMRLITRM